MKVFLPFKPVENTYLFEIENHFQGVFSYGDFNAYNNDYHIVNIHWPEAMFSWKEPTIQQLKDLEVTLKTWKKHSKLIYTRHNEIPHYNQTENYKKLYEIVIKLADGIIHLGEYSLNQFTQETETKHVVIRHPLYLSIPNEISKNEARKILGISDKAKVILVFGKIRSKEENQLIFNSFKGLKISNKVLLIPSMQYFLSNKIPRKLLVLLRYLMKAYYKLHSNYCLKNEFVKTENIQNYFNASDIVFIPRVTGLNSGNLFMGLTFNRVVVGPNIGNIKNILNNLGFPIFKTNNADSVVESISKGFSISENGFENKVNKEQLIEYNSEVVSKQYFNFFKTILNE